MRAARGMVRQPTAKGQVIDFRNMLLAKGGNSRMMERARQTSPVLWFSPGIRKAHAAPPHQGTEERRISCPQKYHIAAVQNGQVAVTTAITENAR
jgi:hypothetical protein